MITRMLKLPAKQSCFLFGPRQTGKSTLIVNNYAKKRKWEIILLHSEVMLKYLKSPELFRKEAVYKIDKEKINAIFIDEIQKVPLLLNEVQALLSSYPSVQFILTGSSPRKLRHGAANLLAGRLVQRNLHSFVHTELQGSFNLDEALRLGTLPPLLDKTEKEKKDILKSYVTTYLREEIQAEGIVRNLGGFSSFLDIAAAQNGEMVNFSSIARDAGLPVRTVQSYYQIIEDTLIVLRVDGWRKSVRKRLMTHPKFYFFDNGVANAINRRMDSVPDTSLRGRLFEQWVVLEAYRLLNYMESEIRVYYWRTSAGAEVDMVLEKSGKLIAACEIKSGKTISSTHASGLRSFGNEHPDVPKYIVCEVDEPYSMGNVDVLPWKMFFKRMLNKNICKF